MAEEKKIRAGDIVQLKGGGPELTVEYITADGRFAEVLWFSCGTLDSRTINLDALKKAEE